MPNLLSRRTLIAGGAATLLHGCASGPAGPPLSSGSRRGPQPGASTPTGGSASPAPRARTVDELLAGDFVVAHRGSGDNWPEHTLTAYLNATSSGADAIEISVRATADGVLVCHHDADTRRTTGIDGHLLGLTREQLRQRPVDARQWLGGATPLEPISSLVDVLAALPDDCLIFIEDKDGTNTSALLDVLDAQPRATERFVWKQWALAQQVGAARKRGYRSWGFFTPDILDRAHEVADLHDTLGVPVDTPDEEIARLIGLGRPVMAWEVHTRHERDRLRALGVAGLMCSNVPYVLESFTPAAADSFASGIRAPGDLPSNYAEGWRTQPLLEAGAEALILRREATPRYLLGSMCPITAPAFRLTFTAAWVGSPGGHGSRAGLAFCLPDDGPYHPRQPNAAGSYQAFLTSDGEVALGYQAAGWTASEKLVTIAHPVAEPTEISVSVSEHKLTLDVAGESISVNHMDARGGYLWLWGEQMSDGVRFSNIRVTEL